MSARRRALLLGALALVLGGLAAADVSSREAALDRRLGGWVDVVVTSRPIAVGKPITADALAVRQVPGRFAPAAALADPGPAVGARAAVALPAGADVTTTVLGGEEEPPPGAPVRSGERVADVTAIGRPALIVPGSRVDVLVTRDEAPGLQGRTVLAMEDVEVLASAPAGQDEGAGQPRVSASLRVTLRQAVALAAAQSFARELRLLPRAAGDRDRDGAGMAAGATGVDDG